MKIRFDKFLSTDNPKAAKAAEFGYLNAINYMAPHTMAGVGNLCVDASDGCREICLGVHSGQAAMSEKVRQSRINKAQYFMRARAEFMNEFAVHIAKAKAKADKEGLKLCVRPNGSTDISFEGVAFELSEAAADRISAATGETIKAGKFRNIFESFPTVQFVDYTKNARRFSRALPANYHLTFSRSETNDAEARALLERGVNVAVVYSDRSLAKNPSGQVVNGDEHDLRHLDPKGGHIIALTPKGHRAKRDQSGFVIRN